jgi:hypothetical protein
MGNGTASGGLKTIFSFFLGLMLVSFVGVGAYTFLPPPEGFESQMQEVNDQKQAVRGGRPVSELTQAERDQIQEMDSRHQELMGAEGAARNNWGLQTSVVLIVLATLAMAVSLIRADQLPVISNGLLLGGVFTMLYGVGWIIATDQAATRFVVMTAALLVTLGLGYMRFVRGGASRTRTDESGTEGAKDLAGLERRLRTLEVRMDQAAAALGPKERREG